VSGNPNFGQLAAFYIAQPCYKALSGPGNPENILGVIGFRTGSRMCK